MTVRCMQICKSACYARDLPLSCPAAFPIARELELKSFIPVIVTVVVVVAAMVV